MDRKRLLVCGRAWHTCTRGPRSATAQKRTENEPKLSKTCSKNGPISGPPLLPPILPLCFENNTVMQNWTRIGSARRSKTWPAISHIFRPRCAKAAPTKRTAQNGHATQPHWVKRPPGRGAQRPPLDSTQTALPFFKARLHRGPARAQRSLTNLVYVAPRPIPPTAVHARRATPAHKYEPEHCPAGLGHLRTGARGLNCQRPFCGPPRRHRWRSHQSSAPTPRSPLS